MTASAVSLDLTKAFDTVSHAILGSLSNDDGAATTTGRQRRRGGNENGKKNNRFIKQNNNFARAAHFFVHFFAITPRLRRENA